MVNMITLLSNIPPHWIGFALSIATLIFWSLSPFYFAEMGKRVTFFNTNLMRLGLATIFLVIIIGTRQLAGSNFHIPKLTSCLWLASSGVFGLVIGDLFLYKMLVTDGPEKTSQIQTLTPAVTAIMAWIFLREFLSFLQLAGMVLILTGVYLATWEVAHKKNASNTSTSNGNQNNLKSSHKSLGRFTNGIWGGIWFSLFQGLGTVFARQAFLSAPDLDPILATCIRITSGFLVILLFAKLKGPLYPILISCRQQQVFKLLLAGTVAGPFVGMICYIAALKYISAGVVTTVAFMSPLIVIPLGALYYRTRIGKLDVFGTTISLAGVILLGFG